MSRVYDEVRSITVTVIIIICHHYITHSPHKDDCLYSLVIRHDSTSILVKHEWNVPAVASEEYESKKAASHPQHCRLSIIMVVASSLLSAS